MTGLIEKLFGMSSGFMMWEGSCWKELRPFTWGQGKGGRRFH